jgi:membrane protease YdiL (CAAX protease family)
VAIGDATLTYALLNLGLRLLIWVLPVLLYLRYVDRVEPFGYLGLRRHVGRGVAVAAGVTALNLLGSIARFGPPHPVAQSITWNSVLGTSLLVGFIEEIPYRGFILQKLAERIDFWLANAITSLLFVAIHVPGWIVLHALAVQKAGGILVFGAVMAAVFRWSASLWRRSSRTARTTSCRSSSFTPDHAAIRVAAAEPLSAAPGATG